MTKRVMTGLKLTLWVAALALPALPVTAQINVSSKLTVSSGSCTGCDFSNKTMPRVTFQRSNFSGSLFNRSNLSGGHIIDSDLSGAHFKKAFLARIDGERVNFTDARLEDATLTEAKLIEASFNRSDLRRADLSRAEMTNSDFENADLTGAIAVGAQLTNCNFSSAHLNNIDFLGAQLGGSVFRGAEFGTALVKGAQLDGADISGADMSMVRGLTQTQLSAACGDGQTQLPIGLSVKYCPESPEMRASFAAGHTHTPVRDKRDEYLSARIDQAIDRVEGLIGRSSGQQRIELQRVHGDLVSARRKIESAPR